MSQYTPDHFDRELLDTAEYTYFEHILIERGHNKTMPTRKQLISAMSQAIDLAQNLNMHAHHPVCDNVDELAAYWYERDYGSDDCATDTDDPDRAHC